MIRRFAGCAVVFFGLVLVVAAIGVWQLRVPKPVKPPLAGELRSSAITVDDRQRTFSFYVPARVGANPPLLLVLHGSGRTGRQMRVATGYAYDELADREGFVVAYPDGYRGYWNDCRAVGDYDAKRLGVNDVAFLRALTGWFGREHRIATDKVFAVGLSNGAAMSYRLALEAPELVRGVAAIASNLPTPENQTCAPSGKPVATMIVNGTDDPLNPHEGGPVALYKFFLKRGNVQSTMATAEYWAKLAGHQSPPVVQNLPDTNREDGATATRYRWSGGGKPSVALLVVNGGGHTIPHPEVRFPRLLGRTCHDFSSAQEIWRFFAGDVR